MKINIVIDIDDQKIQDFINENHCYDSEVLGEINNTAYCGIDCILAMLARRFDGLEGDGYVLKKDGGERWAKLIP